MKYFLLIFAGIIGFQTVNAQSGDLEEVVHPRLLLHATELQKLKNKLNQPPFRHWLDLMQRRVKAADSSDYSFMNGDLAPDLAFLGLVTGDKTYAEKAFREARRIIKHESFDTFYAFGLRKAQMVKNLAICYDFAYPLWSLEQREEVNEAIYRGMVSTNASMGRSANYNIASNWMGIRFAGVLLGALAYDDELSGSEKSTIPFIWDATKRLQEHLHANFHQDGWNGESLGYFQYAWTAVGPALIALQHFAPHPDFKLNTFAPRVQRSYPGVAVSYVAADRGLKPDLSDDNLFMSILMLSAQGFFLFPPEQHPGIKWMFDYGYDDQRISDSRGGLLYTLLYYPRELDAVNPESLGWTTFIGEEKGIALYRNRFRNEDDILFVHNVSAHRVKGHRGPDANTIRLIGLGYPWIIGGGRTGQIAGQSTFFPDQFPKEIKPLSTGYWMPVRRHKQGLLTRGKGSNTGVTDHIRQCWISYDRKYGAEAVMVVTDSSRNGRRWRINTPEFMKIEEIENGVMLRAPSGESLRVLVVGQRVEDIIWVKTRYGGTTQDHNPLIRFGGNVYENSHAIDLITAPNVQVVMTLQLNNKAHPNVRATPEGLVLNSEKTTL